MLKFLRKLFGCYHECEIIIPEPIMGEPFNTFNDVINEPIMVPCEDTQKNKIIGNIINAVINEKQDGFISYTEEAMNSVTDNKFCFIKYRK